MVPFPCVVTLVFCVILEEVIQVTETFLFALGGLWRAAGLLFKRSLFVLHVHLVLTPHGKKFPPFIFANA
jgi:hypothetical protein